MKKTPWVALAAMFVLSLPSYGQVVAIAGGGKASDLQCPGTRHKAPTRPASDAEEGVPEPPSLDELEGVLPAEASATGETFFSPAPRSASRPPAIAFWGDSHLAAHFFQDELVRLSGLRRSQVQPTFLPATLGRPGVRLPIRKHCQGDGWSYRYAYTSPSGPVAFGPGLAQLRSQAAGAYLWIDFRLQAGEEGALDGLDILFAPDAGNASLIRVALSVDDGEEQIVTLDNGGDGRLHLQAEQPFSIVRLRLEEGALALEGFKPSYAKPAVARMDTLAIPGATARGWGNSNFEYVRDRLGGQDYDFVVLEYGTNEGNQRSFSDTAYAADLRAALGNLRRVLPAAQCLLVGPTDRGVLVRHSKGKGKRKAKPAKPDLLHYARIHRQIADIQREVGKEFGCGFWDWQGAMGGPGGAYRWLYRSPRLMAKDLIHLTMPGYQQSAREFARAVRFSEWLPTGNSPQ